MDQAARSESPPPTPRYRGGAGRETGRLPGVNLAQMPRTSIDELLARARGGLTRLGPAAARDAMASGATLIDIRADAQIAADGVVPEGGRDRAATFSRWRLDPASEDRPPGAPGLDEHIILMCNEGYQSSLAAATLQQLGFARATDLDGGFQAWCSAGFPIALASRIE